MVRAAARHHETRPTLGRHASVRGRADQSLISTGHRPALFSHAIRAFQRSRNSTELQMETGYAGRLRSAVRRRLSSRSSRNASVPASPTEQNQLLLLAGPADGVAREDRAERGQAVLVRSTDEDVRRVVGSDLGHRVGDGQVAGRHQLWAELGASHLRGADVVMNAPSTAPCASRVAPSPRSACTRGGECKWPWCSASSASRIHPTAARGVSQRRTSGSVRTSTIG